MQNMNIETDAVIFPNTELFNMNFVPVGNVICPGCIGLYLVEQDAKFKFWSYLYLYRDQASPWHP